MFSYICYIDESGDEGLSGKPNSSRWFILTGVIIRNVNDGKIVGALKEIRDKFNYPAKKPLHWNRLKHEQKVYYSVLISNLPIRICNVCVDKSLLLEKEKFRGSSRLYFYAVRYLIERVSWFIKQSQNLETGKCQLIFSNRASMSYDDLKQYLNLLKTQQEKLIRDIRIEFDFLDFEVGFSTLTAGRRAGLQIADACAGALFNALEINNYGFREDRYFSNIHRLLYSFNKVNLGYGIKLFPKESLFEIKKDPELVRILKL